VCFFFQQTGVQGGFAQADQHYTAKVSTYLQINDACYICSSAVYPFIVTFRDVMSTISYNYVVVGRTVMFPGSIFAVTEMFIAFVQRKWLRNILKNARFLPFTSFRVHRSNHSQFDTKIDIRISRLFGKLFPLIIRKNERKTSKCNKYVTLFTQVRKLMITMVAVLRNYCNSVNERTCTGFQRLLITFCCLLSGVSKNRFKLLR
jgi:hypothetical protein